MLNRVAIGLLAGTLLSAPALAQTGTTAPSGTTTTVPVIQQNQQGTQMNQQGSAATMQGGNIQYVTENRPDLWRASRLEGVNVYNQNNERIGDISEVLVNEQGQVEAVVIGVGGFLGIGERSVAVPFNALQWQQEEARTAATGTGAAGTVGTAGTGMGAGGQTGTNTAMTGAAPANNNRAATGATGTAGTTTAMTNNASPATTGTVGDAYGVRATAGDEMRDYPERAILPNATKEMLERAPEFRYSR
ncbi:PRC-barrel domain-containing protein [Microvirga lenta]|uniref:PRC-barrel domain-containing protein n=1 Tax=Microvirga lenta TaxID=2881337 RepID=UPI001CFFBBBE|nr:PRC-barrel domain-containing protein [Microvirga lenta]MCB5176414.1 PRC-barrel domain-containing protein [Microvirga lenta]